MGIIVGGGVYSTKVWSWWERRAGHEGSMTVEVSSNGVEYTRGGMTHREARLTVVGPSTGPEARLVGDGMMRGGMHNRCRFGPGMIGRRRCGGNHRRW